MRLVEVAEVVVLLHARDGSIGVRGVGGAPGDASDARRQIGRQEQAVEGRARGRDGAAFVRPRIDRIDDCRVTGGNDAVGVGMIAVLPSIRGTRRMAAPAIRRRSRIQARQPIIRA